MPGAKKPNVIEAHAMELIKSLLFQGMLLRDASMSLHACIPPMYNAETQVVSMIGD